MAASSVPNTQDVDVDKPMVLKDEKKSNTNRKQSHGLGLFKKKSTSNQELQTESKTNESDPSDHHHKKGSDSGSKKKTGNDSNVFAKLGKIFHKSSSKNDSSSSANKQINAKLKQEEEMTARTVRMLLLGAGGSGKSTVFKQMEKLYKGDVDEKQLEAGKEDIYRNILTDIHELCKFNIKQNSEDLAEFQLADEVKDACLNISHWPSHYILEDPKSRLTRSLALDIDRLWRDPAMKATWKKRKNSHIMDNTPYFFEKILEIVPDPDDQKTPEWKCTFGDFVRVRDQTTGIIVKHFLVDTELGRYNFEVTDVGGQRSERRKWMRLFDNISVVVYIMSLAAYDQHLYEDNTKRCWDETLELFSKTSHHTVFDTTDWVIFFNKVDLFEEKIKTVPFTMYQPNFNELHAHDSKKVKEFIREQFQYRFYENLPAERKKKRGNLYFHVTCATNSEEVVIILQKVQMDLIKSQMKKMGYLL